MADYFGLEEIATRMGVNRATVGWWIRRFGFPVYKRRRPGHRPRSQRDCRRLYYTNDAMILAWQLGRAETERKERSARAEEKRRMRAIRSGQVPSH